MRGAIASGQAELDARSELNSSNFVIPVGFKREARLRSRPPDKNILGTLWLKFYR
jgi:hypothetical protein